MCVLCVGCWVLGVGCWLLVVGCWVLGVGCWVLGVGCWVLGVGCCVLGDGCWVLGAVCWVLKLGLRCLVMGAGCLGVYIASVLLFNHRKNLTLPGRPTGRRLNAHKNLRVTPGFYGVKVDAKLGDMFCKLHVFG